MAKKKKAATSAQDKALNKLYGQTGNEAGNAMINKFNPTGLSRVSTDLVGGSEETGRLQGLADKYANPSAPQAEALQKMQAGLGGYTSPEMQGMREQQERAQNSNLATGMSQLAKAQARGKVYGAAAGAQAVNLNTASLQSKDDQAQKLMIANADEQQKRLQAYGQYGNQVNAQNFSQQSTIAQDQNKTAEQLRQEQLDRSKINLGQESAEKATNIGLYTGAAGTALASKQNDAANQIAQQGIQAVGGKTPAPITSPAQRKAAKKVKKK